MTATTTKLRTVALVAEPLLVASPGAAKLCGCSTRTWQQLASAGSTPAWVKLANKRLWQVAELRAWTLAGCPTRERWEAEKATPRQAPTKNGLGGPEWAGRIGLADR